MYTLIMIVVGTLAGRHQYFRRQTLKMLGRFYPGLHKKFPSKFAP
jgi:hypothetical protein